MHAERLSGEYGDIVWILAGYKKDMEKLFEHNPGLPSRFPSTFTFEDYTDEELLKMFDSILVSGGVQKDARAKSGTRKSVDAANKKEPMSLSLAKAYQRGYSMSMNKPDEIDQ